MVRWTSILGTTRYNFRYMHKCSPYRHCGRQPMRYCRYI